MDDAVATVDDALFLGLLVEYGCLCEDEDDDAVLL